MTICSFRNLVAGKENQFTILYLIFCYLLYIYIFFLLKDNMQLSIVALTIRKYKSDSKNHECETHYFFLLLSIKMVNWMLLGTNHVVCVNATN